MLRALIVVMGSKFKLASRLRSLGLRSLATDLVSGRVSPSEAADWVVDDDRARAAFEGYFAAQAVQ